MWLLQFDLTNDIRRHFPIYNIPKLHYEQLTISPTWLGAIMKSRIHESETEYQFRTIPMDYNCL